MLFPLGDDNRDVSGRPVITSVLILANVLVFTLLQQFGANEQFTVGYSVIPAEIVNGIDLITPQPLDVGGQRVDIPQAPGPVPIYLTVITAMFMHGGWMHLFGNMLYLWIFGDNIEHRFGSGVFLVFYLVSGIAATIAQIVLDPGSTIPNLGASGAVSGVLGAYLVLFPRNRVTAIFFFQIVSIPAVLALGIWIAFQIVEGLGTLGGSQLGGVAYGAHIGGFVAGAVMAILLRMLIREPDRPVPAGRRSSTRLRRR